MANLYNISKTILDPVSPSPFRHNANVLLVCFNVLVSSAWQQIDFSLYVRISFVTESLHIVYRKIIIYSSKHLFEKRFDERGRECELLFAGIILIAFYRKHDHCSE